MSNETPALEDVLRDVLDAHAASVYTMFPGKVVGYDAARQIANVQPQVKDHVFDESGRVVAQRFPVLQLPVQRLTGGSFFMGAPVEIGDTGQIICATLAIDRWLTTGQESDPSDTRRHSPMHGVFVPGLLPVPSLITELATNLDFVFGIRGGTCARLSPAGVLSVGTLPEAAQDFVALAAKVDDFISRLDHVIRTAWVVAPTDGGAALKAAYASEFSTAPDSVAATKLKTE